MAKESSITFTCDDCSGEASAETYSVAPHGWRVLTWQGGYQGDESREAHYCTDCAGKYLKALDVLLKRAFTS